MADTEGKSSQNSQTSSQFSQSDLPELLHQYYKRLFPYKYFVQWLSYGGGRLFWGNEVKINYRSDQCTGTDFDCRNQAEFYLLKCLYFL